MGNEVVCSLIRLEIPTSCKFGFCCFGISANWARETYCVGHLKGPRASQEQHLEVSAVMWNSFISACTIWQGSLELLSQSCSLHMAQTVTFNVALDACGKAFGWQEALGIFDSLGLQRLPASIVSFNAAIGACGKTAHWQHALHLLREAQDLELEATDLTLTCSTLLRCLFYYDYFPPIIVQ